MISLFLYRVNEYIITIKLKFGYLALIIFVSFVTEYVSENDSIAAKQIKIWYILQMITKIFSAVIQKYRLQSLFAKKKHFR